MLKKYLKPDLLIVDDMGIKRLPKQSGEFLFEIIMRRLCKWTEAPLVNR